MKEFRGFLPTSQSAGQVVWGLVSFKLGWSPAYVNIITRSVTRS